MTVPTLTQPEFLDLLRRHGWHVPVNGNDYFDDYNRIIVSKDGHSFPIQLQKIYYFAAVVKTCLMLGIPPPPDHKLCYDQIVSQRKPNKFDEDF